MRREKMRCSDDTILILALIISFVSVFISALSELIYPQSVLFIGMWIIPVGVGIFLAEID